MKIKKVVMLVIMVTGIISALLGCSASPTVNEDAQEMMDDSRFHETREIKESSVLYSVFENFFDVTMTAPSGILVINDRVLIADSSDNCIYIFSNNGELINAIGKTGNAEMQFLNPSQVVYENSKYYILDSGNSRVQILDEDFEYLNGVELTPIEDFNSDCKYQDLIVDHEGSIYLSVYAIAPKYAKIFKVTPDDIIYEIGSNLIGYLEVVDSLPYFINYKTLYYAQEGIQEQTYVLTYENRLEQIRDNSMETVGELPFGYNPSDFATDGTDIFIYSERFFTLDRFDKEGNYLETLYQFDHNVGIKYLAYDKVTNSIYASVPTEGKVYRFSPEQVE